VPFPGPAICEGLCGGWPRLLTSLAQLALGVPHPSRTLRRVGVGMFGGWPVLSRSEERGL